MTENIFLQIKEFLGQHHITFRSIDHAPTPTSADAARIRGTTPEQGAKALVFRSRGNFFMCVLPGNRKVDLEKMRALLGEKRLSLATPEEVLHVTGCVIGSVPPFGNLFGIPVYVDRSLLHNSEIAFNAGMLTRSIVMKTEDYVRSVQPIVEDFCM